ncbi:MAG: hypothetical protein AB2A00_08210 [Myxococcota bacterium]
MGLAAAATTALDPIMGNPALGAQVLDNEMKGATILTRARCVEDMLGKAALEKVAAALPPDVVDVWRKPPLATSWIPIRQLVEVDRAIITALYGGDVSRIRDLALRGAQYELNAIYRFLLKLGSPGFVMKRLSVAFSAKVKRGVLAEVKSEPNTVTLALREAVLPLYFCEHTMNTWAATAVELTGAKDVKVQQLECRHRGGAACTWVTTWR